MTAKATTGQTAEYVLITPELAEDWLANNNHMNRMMRVRTLDSYQDDAEDGNWASLNGTTISFDTEDPPQLVDGQHRLRMIKETGIPQEYLVVRGVKPGDRVTIDSNLRRNFADDLAMNGVTQTNQKDGLLLTILTWDSLGGLANWRNVRFSRKMRAKVWPIHKDGIEDTVYKTQRWYQRWPGNHATLLFMYWLLAHRVKCDTRAVERFFQIIYIGSQSPDDQVLVELRDKFISMARVTERGFRIKGNKAVEVLFAIRAWNAWLAGTGFNKALFRMPNGGLEDPYPTPIPAITGEFNG